MKDAFTTIKEIARESDRKRGIIEEIAMKKLNIRTLETRNSDNLDFYDLSVASIKEALEAAFSAGCEVGLTLNNNKGR